MKILVVLFFVTSIFLSFAEAGGDGEHHHVIIHVPYKVKTIHHTHTITKHVHHKDEGDDKFEVLGYTLGHPTELHGLGLSHGDGGDGGKEMNLLSGHEYGGHEYGGHEWSSGGMSSHGRKSFEGMEDEHVLSYQSLGHEHSGLGGHAFMDSGYSSHQSFSGH